MGIYMQQEKKKEREGHEGQVEREEHEEQEEQDEREEPKETTKGKADQIRYPSSPVTSKVFQDISPELPLASSSQNDGGVQTTTIIMLHTCVLEHTRRLL